MGAKRWYYVRLKGGLWEPRRKISNLAKAMTVAYQMAEKHGAEATILQSISAVKVVDGKAVWEERLPSA